MITFETKKISNEESVYHKYNVVVNYKGIKQTYFVATEEAAEELIGHLTKFYDKHKSLPI